MEGLQRLVDAGDVADAALGASRPPTCIAAAARAAMAARLVRGVKALPAPAVTSSTPPRDPVPATAIAAIEGRRASPSVQALLADAGREFGGVREAASRAPGATRRRKQGYAMAQVALSDS
jgi:hypothetical protein